MGLTATDFRNLARDCIRDAESSIDGERKQTLLDIARLYTQTAMQIDARGAPRASRTAA
jgi:hypothetical protein